MNTQAPSNHTWRTVLVVIAAVTLVGAVLFAVLAPQQSAFAEDSPEVIPIIAEATSPSGVTATIGTLVTRKDAEDWDLFIEPTETVATGATSLPDNMYVIANFEVWPEWIKGQKAGTTDEEVWDLALIYEYLMGFTLDIGTHQYDGMDVYIYIDHHRDGTGVVKGIVEDGVIHITTKLSIFTIVIDLNSGPNAGTRSVDKSSTSPVTGTDSVDGVISATPTMVSAASSASSVSTTASSSKQLVNSSAVQFGFIAVAGVAALACGLRLRKAHKQK